MKLQYRCRSTHNYRDTFEIYHDGELVESYMVWDDESEEVADTLEEAGYTYGYTQAEVENVRKKYYEMLERVIEKGE